MRNITAMTPACNDLMSRDDDAGKKGTVSQYCAKSDF